MTGPRLIASDLDGTLLRTDGSVSRRTIEAIAAVQDAGVGWVIATSRPPFWMGDVVEVVGSEGVAVCSNGAFVYDVTRRRVVVEDALRATLVADLVFDLRAAIPDVAFGLEHQEGFVLEYGFSDESREADASRVADVLDGGDRSVGKLMARSSSMNRATFLTTVHQIVGGRAEITFAGVTGLAEITGPGVTKAGVLDAWCRDLGVAAADVWAFGDMPNDLAMLGWAGAAYAVANAHADVRAVADHVVASNDEDGVAQALELLVA